MGTRRMVLVAHAFLLFNQFSAIFVYSVGKLVMKEMLPFIFVFSRLTIAIPFMILATFLMKEIKFKNVKYGISYILASGIFGIMLGQAFLYAGIQRSTASNASIISAPCTPIFTAFFSVLQRTDKMTIPKALGFVFAIAGALILLEVEHFELAGKTIGNLLILGSTVVIAINLTIQKKSFKYLSPVQLSAYSSLAGLIIMSVCWAPFDVYSVAQWHAFESHWVLILVTGVFCTAMTWTFSSIALKETSPMTVTVYNILLPPLSALVGYFMGDPFTGRQGLGSALILLGLFLVNGGAMAVAFLNKILLTIKRLSGNKFELVPQIEEEPEEENSEKTLDPEDQEQGLTAQSEDGTESVKWVKMNVLNGDEADLREDDGASVDFKEELLSHKAQVPA